MAPDAILTFSDKSKPVPFWASDASEALIYTVLIGAVVLLALFAHHHGAKSFRKIERALARFARNFWISVAAVGLLSLVLAMVVTAVAGLPLPKVEDEFSYLLAADTFAHGRLTNPPHPMWMHFETLHTIQQPTYASKYPPGQGLILALGQVIGHPVIGVWLSAALACAAIYWMMMAWVPRRWALIGAFLAMLHPEILIWGQRYWGGNLTLAGGALAIGGFRRLWNVRRDDSGSNLGRDAAPVVSDALLMSLGLAILLICRPYEGGVLICILLAALIIRILNGRTKPPLAWMARLGWPIAVSLIVTIGWMCFYNWRVTHHPFRMPYQQYVATYNAAPIFVWQKPPPAPAYRHQEMRDFHMGWDLRSYTKQQGLKGRIKGFTERFLGLLRSNLRLWPLLPAFVALPWTLTNRRMQIALLVWLLFTAAMLQVTWTFFHYAAPAFGMFFIIAVQSLRHLRLWSWRQIPVGLFLGRGCLVLCLLSLPYSCWRIAQQNRYARREKIVTRLTQEGGKHLIIVHYAPGLSNPAEWVYNKADIDRAQIVWAHDMDAAENLNLINYFKDRRVWLLDIDKKQMRLLRYTSASNFDSSLLNDRTSRSNESFAGAQCF